MSFPSAVEIIEVSPRDGLQNEKQKLPTDTKIEFIKQLSGTGLKTIEATSFVSAHWIPQLADGADVLAGINKIANINFPVLVPNAHGMQNAIQAGAKSVAVFTAVSETFSHKNTNCSIAQSMQNIAEVISLAKAHNIPVRGYISCVLGCPFEGQTDFKKTASIAKQLIDLGCYQISLGDTIGVGTPLQAKRLIDEVAKYVAIPKLAVHFHDTYGQALANIYAVMEQGISVIDSSVAGLGGCPYAPGASGNVATEDVLYMLDGMGIKTGVDLIKILQVGRFISNALATEPRSKVAQARSS